MSNGTIEVTSGATGTISFGQSDYSNEKTSTRFNFLNASSVGTFTNSVGEYTWAVDNETIENLIDLWALFTNGTEDTQVGKELNGAALGTNLAPKISADFSANNVPNFIVPNSSQRTLKWRVTLQDTVNLKLFIYDIGCANVGTLTNGVDTMPTELVQRLTDFLEGPEVDAIGSGLTPATQAFNLPIIRSPYGNPMRYVTAIVVGVKFKK